jgi:hypothetical protein
MPSPPPTPVVLAEEPMEPCSEVAALPTLLLPLPPEAVPLDRFSFLLMLRGFRPLGVAVAIEFLVLGLDVADTLPNLFKLRLAPPAPPTGRMAPEPLFRFLMTSVLRDNGLTTPYSFRKRPQAL